MQVMLQPIVSLILKARRTSTADFMRVHPEPVFVVEPFDQGSDEISFETLRPGAGAGPGMLGPAMAPIKKRAGANAFGMMVTIGRAKNNDIQILAPQVSKFHAYVMFGPEGQASLTDAGSTCGTRVGERTLAANSDRVPLQDGDVIHLGDVQLTFFTPAEFHDYLVNLKE